MIDTIILIRNIFYRAFVIGLAFYIFTFVFWMLFKEWTINYAISLFAGITKHEIIMLMIYSISFMKAFTFYGFLIPAVALHWTGNTLKKEKKG